MSGQSYISIPSSEVKPLAEASIQSILDAREEIKKDYFQHKYAWYRFWRHFWPFGPVKSLQEFRDDFDVNTLSLSEYLSYSTCEVIYGYQYDKLKDILGLCQLKPDGEIQLSSDDASAMGYPEKRRIPLPTEERERLRAEDELQSVTA